MLLPYKRFQTPHFRLGDGHSSSSWLSVLARPFEVENPWPFRLLNQNAFTVSSYPKSRYLASWTWKYFWHSGPDWWRLLVCRDLQFCSMFYFCCLPAARIFSAVASGTAVYGFPSLISVLFLEFTFPADQWWSHFRFSPLDLCTFLPLPCECIYKIWLQAFLFISPPIFSLLQLFFFLFS